MWAREPATIRSSRDGGRDADGREMWITHTESEDEDGDEDEDEGAQRKE